MVAFRKIFGQLTTDMWTLIIFLIVLCLFVLFPFLSFSFLLLSLSHFDSMVVRDIIQELGVEMRRSYCLSPFTFFRSQGVSICCVFLGLLCCHLPDSGLTTALCVA